MTTQILILAGMILAFLLVLFWISVKYGPQPATKNQPASTAKRWTTGNMCPMCERSFEGDTK